MRMVDVIDWEVMLDEKKTPRYAGSHVDQLSNLFLDSEVIASSYDDDYQGADCMVYLFAPPNPKIDPKIVIITSYFGSCSGCDSWEDAGDEDLRELLTAMVNNARIFGSFDKTIKFLDEIDAKVDAGSYGEFYDLHGHTEEIKKQVKEAEARL